MNRRAWINGLSAAFLLVPLLMAQAPRLIPSNPAASDRSSSFEKNERNYAMNVSVRPFLFCVNGREYQELIESKFEAFNTATHETSSFSVTYGTDAGISNIPIRITYQPRWWFRAELLLDEGPGMEQIARRVGDQ